MTETLRISYIVDGVERRCELIREPAKMDDETWNWLRGSFVSMGFNKEAVEEFFR